jgi:hypothetical protein
MNSDMFTRPRIFADFERIKINLKSLDFNGCYFVAGLIEEYRKEKRNESYCRKSEIAAGIRFA